MQIHFYLKFYEFIVLYFINCSIFMIHLTNMNKWMYLIIGYVDESVLLHFYIYY